MAAVALTAIAVLAACTGGGRKPKTTTVPTTVALQTFNQGGDVVVAAEGEPGCMDWISTCAGSVWGVWTVETNTMPRAYDFTSGDLYKPSILLSGEAVLVTAPQQVVTYHLNGKAVWSDGQPITSHDFKYTWDQIAHGQSISDQTGYKNIVSVDDSDPTAAVVTFSQPFADWKQLFGGAFGILPSHILEGHDRNALMKGGYAWSGGPWALAPNGWTKTESIKLVPNPNYWGKRPNLSSLTFKVITDPVVELQDYVAGNVLAAYPRAQPAVTGYKVAPGTSFSSIAGLDFEALWFNVQKAPLDSKAVRQAIAYSLDRQAITSQLFAPILAGIQPIQSLLTPAYGKAYSQPFAKYRPDLNMVNQLMTGDGWAKGTDGIWAKGKQQGAIEVKYTTGSQRRQLTVQMVQSQLRLAGFLVVSTPESSATLFGQDLPAGKFVAGVFGPSRRLEAPGVGGGGINDNDPGQCRLFCSTSIPTTANGLTGINYSRLNDPNVDRLFTDLDTDLDENARIQDAIQGASALADLVPAIPIAPIPDIVVVNSGKIGVEGGTFDHNLAYGPYAFVNGWYLK